MIKHVVLVLLMKYYCFINLIYSFIFLVLVVLQSMLNILFVIAFVSILSGTFLAAVSVLKVV